MRPILRSAIWLLGAVSLVSAQPPDQSFIGHLHNNKLVGSTVPANGDVNPYGVAVVPRTIGSLHEGDILVSNFNNKDNLQGTGTTIVELGANGKLQVFAEIPETSAAAHSCPGGVGLTTALVALHAGWVIVGSLPTTDGMPDTIKPGCLFVLNPSGQVVETLSGTDINGPWDATAAESDEGAALFVSNVLDGTIVRIVLALNGENEGDDDGAEADDDSNGNGIPREVSRTIVASGFGHRFDPAALVIGPTGLGLTEEGTLYVADTFASRIAAVPNVLAMPGAVRTVSQGSALNAPLGLALAPNGDIVTVNGGDGNMVEVTPAGRQVAVKNVDTTGAGAGTLFGLAIAHDAVYFVNDGNNTLNVLH